MLAILGVLMLVGPGCYLVIVVPVALLILILSLLGLRRQSPDEAYKACVGWRTHWLEAERQFQALRGFVRQAPEELGASGALAHAPTLPSLVWLLRHSSASPPVTIAFPPQFTDTHRNAVIDGLRSSIVYQLTSRAGDQAMVGLCGDVIVGIFQPGAAMQVWAIVNVSSLHNAVSIRIETGLQVWRPDNFPGSTRGLLRWGEVSLYCWSNAPPWPVAVVAGFALAACPLMLVAFHFALPAFDFVGTHDDFMDPGYGDSLDLKIIAKRAPFAVGATYLTQQGMADFQATERLMVTAVRDAIAHFHWPGES